MMLLLALLLVKSYFDPVVRDHTVSQNATGRWPNIYFGSKSAKSPSRRPPACDVQHIASFSRPLCDVRYALACIEAWPSLQTFLGGSPSLLV